MIRIEDPANKTESCLVLSCLDSIEQGVNPKTNLQKDVSSVDTEPSENGNLFNPILHKPAGRNRTVRQKTETVDSKNAISLTGNLRQGLSSYLFYAFKNVRRNDFRNDHRKINVVVFCLQKGGCSDDGRCCNDGHRRDAPDDLRADAPSVPDVPAYLQDVE